MGKNFTIINNGEIQKQVNNNILQEYLSNGWVCGRLYPAWNKGLTMNDDIRVYKNVKSLRKYYENLTPKQKELRNQKLRGLNLGRKWSAESIAKRSETRKGFVPSLQQRQKTSQKLKGHFVSEETRKKLSQANKGKKGVVCTEEMRKYLSALHSSKEYQEKENAIKKRNNTFNTSKPEQRALKMLKQLYGDDLEYSYRDIRFPYNCDFYIKSKDLFIELNYLWTHGFQPFDKTNPKHLEKLKDWENKSLYSKYYKNAIYTWTELDVKKREIAIKNKLNYLTFYKEKDFVEWYEYTATRLGTKYVEEINYEK